MEFLATITAKIYYSKFNNGVEVGYYTSFVDVYQMDSTSLFCEIKLPLGEIGDDMDTDLQEALRDKNFEDPCGEYTYRLLSEPNVLHTVRGNYAYSTVHYV